MSVDAVVSHLEDANHGAILTFIVPSRGGCNLKCSFCYINQRKENFELSDIEPSFYIQFIREVLEKRKISAICIQGHEPLLPDSMRFTFAILEEACFIGLPTGLVTNGTYLAHSIESLCEFPPDRIAVSLDAADASSHDRQRGVSGAWGATITGLQHASHGLIERSELVVTSVLMPKRRKQLEGMPALLKELGITRWVVNPLLKVGEDKIGKAVGNHQQLRNDLLFLKNKADEHAIDFMVDDELDLLSNIGGDRKRLNLNEVIVKRLPNRSNLFRLLPTGRCSVGRDISRRVRPNSPRWKPDEEHAASFIERMRSLHLRAASGIQV